MGYVSHAVNSQLKNLKTKAMKYLKRILASPFFLCILIICLCADVLARTYQFLRYGGEVINHTKDDQQFISDIYRELKKYNKPLLQKEEIVLKNEQPHEELSRKTFNLANELAIAGYGDEAVKLHAISNKIGKL